MPKVMAVALAQTTPAYEMPSGHTAPKEEGRRDRQIRELVPSSSASPSHFTGCGVRIILSIGNSLSFSVSLPLSVFLYLLPPNSFSPSSSDELLGHDSMRVWDDVNGDLLEGTTT